MDKQQLAARMDHTALQATVTPEQVERLCREALDMGAATVCVNPCNVAQAAALLQGSAVGVCAVVGFPLGANTPETKAFETRDAVARGAQEIDMVINIGALLAADEDAVESDIAGVVAAAGAAPVKVIIETCYLSDAQKRIACRLAQRAGAAYAKTSTGFGPGGATAEDVRLMREAVGDGMKIKAAGGIRTRAAAMAMIQASADRLGVSAGPAILMEAK